MRKRISSGFGRSYAQVLVVVRKPYDDEFLKSGWKERSRDALSTTFDFVCPNRYQGDDESIVHALWGELPQGIDGDHFEIDWENSVY